MATVWTPERIETMLTDWRTGRSAQYIATKLDLTKNAVIGKLNRLGARDRGLGGRRLTRVQMAGKRAKAPTNYNPKTRRPTKSTGLNEAARVKQAAFTAAAETGNWIERFPDAITAKPVALLDLGPRQCRWPCANGGKTVTHFCGKGTRHGESYCHEHMLVAFSPEGRRRREAQIQAEAQFRNQGYPATGQERTGASPQ